VRITIVCHARDALGTNSILPFLSCHIWQINSDTNCIIASRSGIVFAGVTPGIKRPLQKRLALALGLRSSATQGTSSSRVSNHRGKEDVFRLSAPSDAFNMIG